MESLVFEQRVYSETSGSCKVEEKNSFTSKNLPNCNMQEKVKTAANPFSLSERSTDFSGDKPTQYIKRESFSQEMTLFNDETINLTEEYQFKQSIDQCIGNGSYGRVFRGTNTTNNTGVAVKEMLSILVKENELQVLQIVSSNFLVRLFKVCQDVSSIHTYLIMELCDTDLCEYLKFDTPQNCLNEQNLRVVIDNVIRGYHVLYQHKIVHRDIKPPNILIMLNNPNLNEPGGILSAKITDFGISRVLEGDENDSQGELPLSNVAGTLHYMAPEIGVNLLQVNNYNYSVDVWSIGCVLFECLTGRVPFDEGQICRLFLYAAGDNYEAYEQPLFPSDCHSSYQQLIEGMLMIRGAKRTKPNELLQIVDKWQEKQADH
uniref:Protein kinase domain-containing protein n=1 Tax=Rhabditophanes sp. KR3021 TaxID=114890 RepID=A0AC35U6L8_9BILA